MLSRQELTLGLTALAALVGCVALAAVCLQRRFFPARAWSERLAIQGTLGCAAALYPSLALGFLGALRLAPLLALELGLAAASVALWIRAGRPRPEPDPGWRQSPAHLACLVVLVGFGLFMADFGLRHPPLAWDDLFYHLPRVVEWYQSGRLGPLYHPQAPDPGYYPGSAELFVLWAVLPLGNDLLAGWTNLVFLALAAVAVQRLAVDAGAPARLAPLAPLCFALTACIARLAPTAYAEPLLTAAALLALHFSLRAAESLVPRSFLLAGLAAGLAIGAKVTGPLVAAIAVAPALVAARRAARPFHCSAALLLAAAPGAGWLLANAWLAGNPVYPVSLFGLPGMELPFGRLSLASRLGELAGEGHLWWALLGSSDPGLYRSGIGVKLVPLVGVWLYALARARRSGERGAQAWLFGVALAWSLPFALSPVYFSSNVYLQVRFLAPSLAVLVAVGIAALARLHPRAALGLAAVCVAADLPSLVRGGDEALRLGVGIACSAALVLALSRLDPGRLVRRAALVALLPAAALLGLVLHPLHAAREDRRHRDYAQGWSLFQTVAPRYAAGWRFLDAHAAPDARVAWNGFDYLYPSYGPRLARRVRYVDLNLRAGGAFHAYPGAVNRADAEPSAWEYNLERFGAQWLYLERTAWKTAFPRERAWADARPDRFELAFENGWTRIYRVRGGDGSW